MPTAELEAPMYTCVLNASSDKVEGYAEIVVTLPSVRPDGFIRLTFSKRATRKESAGNIFVAKLLEDCELHTPYDGMFVENGGKTLRVLYELPHDFDDLANAGIRLRTRLDRIIRDWDQRWQQTLNVVHERGTRLLGED